MNIVYESCRQAFSFLVLECSLSYILCSLTFLVQLDASSSSHCMLEIEHAAVQPLYRSDDSNDIDMVCVLLASKRSTQQSGYSLVGGYNILLEKVICTQSQPSIFLG